MPELARDMRQNLMAVGKLYLKHCIGQRLYDGTLELNHHHLLPLWFILLGQFAFSSPVQRASALRISLFVSRAFALQLKPCALVAWALQAHMLAALALRVSARRARPFASRRKSPSSATTSISCPLSLPVSDSTMSAVRISALQHFAVDIRKNLRLSIRNSDGVFVVSGQLAVRS